MSNTRSTSAMERPTVRFAVPLFAPPLCIYPHEARLLACSFVLFVVAGIECIGVFQKFGLGGIVVFALLKTFMIKLTPGANHYMREGVSQPLMSHAASMLARSMALHEMSPTVGLVAWVFVELSIVALLVLCVSHEIIVRRNGRLYVCDTNGHLDGGRHEAVFQATIRYWHRLNEAGTLFEQEFIELDNAVLRDWNSVSANRHHKESYHMV